MRNFRKYPFFWALAAILVTVASAPAQAEQHFLICVPGAPGSAADASERVKSFLALLEKDVGPMTGHYATRPAECDRILQKHSPRFGLFSHGELARRSSDLKPVPLLEVEGLDSGPLQYHLIVRKGEESGPVAGEMLSPHWEDFPWIRTLFVDMDWTGVQGKRKSALRSLKKLAKGKVQSVLVNEKEKRAMAELPFGPELEVHASSADLPGLALVELGGLSSKGKKLRKAGAAVCKAAPAQCKGVEIRSLKATTVERYRLVLGKR